MRHEVYRLPAEAEWEYAARAGTQGDRYGNLDAIARYGGASGRRTHPVGGKAPNAWGLHDVLGNVVEWVGDWYGDYGGGPVTDPQGPRSGPGRVIRGGCWVGAATHSRTSNRNVSPPDVRYDFLGFRLLRTE
ncbi:MAG: SUMF1/EgtB/PvdO family nonheme iron enzyme [Acidobacteria bacterium]|nr:SUMF1/EgtB/PvdO family nonheme iron enzyme [Acidobacteriota bacterium]